MYNIIYYIFERKVNIWNFNSAWATALIFDTETGVLVKVSKVFETKNVSTWEGLEPPTSGFMPNALTYWAIRARHVLSHVFEHCLWWYRYFLSTVYIWNFNCARATAFIFDTQTGVLVKVSKVFETANVSTWGRLEPPTSGLMSNALTYWAIRARHLLSHVFLTLALSYHI